MTNETSSLEKYRTSVPRLKAAIVDGLLIIIFTGTFQLIFRNLNNAFSDFLLLITNNLIPVCYTIILNYKFGQTLGKHLFDIKVLDNKTENQISIKQAFLRDSPWLFLAVFDILFKTAGLFSNEIQQNGVLVFLDILSQIFNLIWIIVELITLLTNEKRRSLNDFIAGTVVVVRV